MPDQHDRDIELLIELLKEPTPQPKPAHDTKFKHGQSPWFVAAIQPHKEGHHG